LRGFSARELKHGTAAFSRDAFLLLRVLVLSAAVLVLDSTSCRGGGWRATAGLSLKCDLLWKIFRGFWCRFLKSGFDFEHEHG
jgi:hypothetical protein